MNRQDAMDAKAEPTERLDVLARSVIGAAIEVHRHLGPGYLESVYEETMAIELDLRGVSFERQKPIGVSYKGREVGQGRIDLLKATDLHLGLLINFNGPVLRAGIKRIVRS